jgi:hypothetical protein
LVKSPISRRKANATNEAKAPIASAKLEIGKTRVVAVKSPRVSHDRLDLCAAWFPVAMTEKLEQNEQSLSPGNCARVNQARARGRQFITESITFGIARHLRVPSSRPPYR